MLSFQSFGGVSIVGESGPLSGPATQRRRLALLAVLAATPRPVSRDKLIAYFWPEEERDRARHFLADSVFTLRKHLGKDSVLTVGDDLLLNQEVLPSDVVRFHDALGRGDGEAAAALYRGPFLDGFFVADAPEFERWVEAERDRLARLYAAALEVLAARREEGGDHPGAAAWWRKLAAHDPFNARIAVRLMRALHASGDRAGALRHARVHAALMREEFDAAPDPEVEACAAELGTTPDPRPAAATQGAAEGEPADDRPGDGSAGAAGALPAPGPQPRRLPQRRRRLVVVPLAVLGVLILSATVWRQRGGRDDASGPDPAVRPPTTTLAILPFSVQGGPEHGYLREGLVTLLGTRLDEAGGLRAVDPYRLLSHAADAAASEPLTPENASTLASALDAEFFVLGTVVGSGETVRIVASLYRRGAATDAVATVSAEGVDPFAAADELSRQLLAGPLGFPGDRHSQVAVRTTRSLPALRAYLQGEEEFRAARYDGAAEAFRRAVDEDPSFALAYYRLSNAAEWSFRFVEARQAAESAVRLGESLSTRDRLLVTAWHRFLNGEADEAERLYDAILVDDPSDVEAWSGVGEVRAHYNPVRGRRLDEAVPAFTRVLQLAPNYGEARFHMMEFAARRGDVATFDSLLSGVDPRSQQLLAWRAARAASWGPRVEDDPAIRGLGAADEVVVGIAAVRAAAHFGSLSGAEVLARRLLGATRPEGWRAAARVLLAQARLARGDRQAAELQLDSVRGVEPAWALEIGALGALLPHVATTPDALRDLRRELEAWDPLPATPETAFFFATHADVHVQLRLYLLAVLSDRLGEETAAERYAEQLRDAGATREAREFGASLVRSFQAHRAWGRGDPEGALRLLDEGRLVVPLERIALSPFFAQGLDRFLRAEALRALHRPEEALAWYASLTDGPDILFWAPAHERQGEILRELGRAGEAARHLERSRSIRQPDAPVPSP